MRRLPLYKLAYSLAEIVGDAPRDFSLGKPASKSSNLRTTRPQLGC